MKTIWKALAACQSFEVRKRSAKFSATGRCYVCRRCRSYPLEHCHCPTPDLFAYDGTVYAYVRLRSGETIDAMVWRGLAELQRRAIDGMPRPDPKVMERRRVRKVRDAAIDAFSTIDGSTPH